MTKGQKRPPKKGAARHGASPARQRVQKTLPPATAPGGASASGHAKASGSRRAALRLARNSLIGLALLGGGGWVAVAQVQKHYRLHDLDAIGNGVPSVVQIHDPDCPICNRLKSAMLDAASGVSEDELLVRLANINTTEGRALASRHRASHATLLFFDGNGRVRQVMQGEQPSHSLRDAFEAHIVRSTAREARSAPAS